MCTKEEMAQAFEKNNNVRDSNLERKLNEQMEKIFIHIQKQLKDLPTHQTSPKTIEELNYIKQTCSSRGTELALMNQLLKEVCLKQDKQEEKLDKIREENRVDRNEMNEERKRQHAETMEKLETISEIKADKSSLDKLEGFVSKVLWLSVTAVLGFFSTAIWFLIDLVIDK